MSRIFIIILFCYALSLPGQSQQPYSSHWFVQELLEWTSEEDPHARFNVSHVPLKTRFTDSATQIRPELSTDPSIMVLVASHPTSHHPSQGFSSIKHYAFPFWQYTDYFVQWGGSSGEGIIVSPTAPWIDAAHRNGVEVFGTVFFPPNVYGGKEEWIRDFLQTDPNGNFLLADKLLEVAEYYGFDGWFINQETHGLNHKEADQMQKFMAYYKDRAKEKYKIIWYDAMIEDGRVIWQDELNKHNSIYFQKDSTKLSDFLFIDFGWSISDLEDSQEYVKNLSRSNWDLFAGIDLQSRSFRSYVNWEALYKNGGPYTTSIGLYWPNSTFDIAEYKNPEEVYKNEQKLWNGTTFQILRGTYEWKGFSKYFPARSVIDEWPFVTNFNYGLGRFYNDNGTRLSDEEWHNLSIQDILPTWQWHVDTTAVRPTFSFKESYTGGSCLEVESISGGLIPLYKTSLTIDIDSNLSMVSKSDSELSALLVLQLASGELIEIGINQTKNWSKTKKSLKGYTGQKIVKISLKLQGEGKLFLGELKLLDKDPVISQAPFARVTQLADEHTSGFVIEIEEQENVDFYSIYQKIDTKRLRWLGKTASTNYYISDQRINNDVDWDSLIIVPISKAGIKGEECLIKIEK